jgi:vibriolysin
MRVHYSDSAYPGATLNHSYCNAFWNGKTITFGDGDRDNMFPLVCLDIAAHEVAHGFTESHSNLEYHDMSGALNESYSDIAAIAVVEFVRQNYPELYASIYPDLAGELAWKIGSTVMRSGEPMRYMDFPSKDGESADSFRSVEDSYISYDNVEEQARGRSSDETAQQSYIVHKGSGIFNRAFYLLSKRWGVEKAFRAIAFANIKYWTSQVDFDMAANGVLNAASDLGYEEQDVIDIFEKVGINAI